MRYYIIINPPQYRDNSEDECGFAWAGEASDEAEAFESACDDCERMNGWGKYDEDPALAELSGIDRSRTNTIECGPDYKFMHEQLAPILTELLAYEREAFEEDTPIDLADLCTAFGAYRARLKTALGLPLVGVETAYV